MSIAKKSITLYLQIHQPFRIRRYSIFDTAEQHDYFDEYDTASKQNNEVILRKVVEKSYRPMNALLERLIAANPKMKLSFSISGMALEQFELWAPDIIESFQRLAATGQVEFLSETYHHSLAYFYSQSEFEAQVEIHKTKLRELFGVEPRVFRNTELAYNDALASWADEKGYKGILAEGWESILGWRSPNYVYKPINTENIKLLLKNYKLSDDIAFRFSDQSWPQWPLTGDKYVDWLDASANDGSNVNLFMDYETFGEHQWADTGIFAFFEDFVQKWTQSDERTFYTISEAIDSLEAVGDLSSPTTITWADTERDLSAWLGNSMQQEALKYLYDLEADVIRSKDQALIDDWRKLQSSDHSYYMSTKWFNDGMVHEYFSPYDSPYEAFLYFMNVVRDVRYRLMAYQHYGGLHV